MRSLLRRSRKGQRSDHDADPPTKVMVFRCPCGTDPINRSPRRQRPFSRTMLVLVAVSSINTNRVGSSIPCSRTQRRRTRATSGRSCSAARRLFQWYPCITAASSGASLPGRRPPCPSPPPARSSRQCGPGPAGLGRTAPGPESGSRRPSASPGASTDRGSG